MDSTIQHASWRSRSLSTLRGQIYAAVEMLSVRAGLPTCHSEPPLYTVHVVQTYSESFYSAPLRLYVLNSDSAISHGTRSMLILRLVCHVQPDWRTPPPRNCRHEPRQSIAITRRHGVEPHSPNGQLVKKNQVGLGISEMEIESHVIFSCTLVATPFTTKHRLLHAWLMLFTVHRHLALNTWPNAMMSKRFAMEAPARAVIRVWTNLWGSQIFNRSVAEKLSSPDKKRAPARPARESDE